MRKGDKLTNRVVYGDTVEIRKPLPWWVRTPALYMPNLRPASEMTLEQARRGLCAKSRGKIDVCRKCPAPCGMGKRCMELTGGTKA